VIPGTTQSTRAYLFVLNGMESEVRPSISAQNRYGLDFQYSIALEPGATKSLRHHVAQVSIPQSYNRRALLELFRPFRITESQPGGRGNPEGPIVNGPRKEGSNREWNGEPWKAWGVERGNDDQLIIGERTRLLGTARGGPLQVTSPYGEAEIPMASVSALQGTNSIAESQARIYLRDGQILSGSLEIEEFSFLKREGQSVPIAVNSLDRLVMRKGDVEKADAEQTFGYLMTNRGDRLLVSPAPFRLEVSTLFGSATIGLTDLVEIRRNRELAVGHWIELSNGSQCAAFVGPSQVAVNSPLLGELSFSAQDLVELTLRDRSEDRHGSMIIGDQSAIYLPGEQVIIGDVSNTTIPILVGGVLVETPYSSIRRMKREQDQVFTSAGLPESIPSFEVETWDGDFISGAIQLDDLTLKFMNQDWTIPFAEVVEIEAPLPDLSPNAISTIEQLLENLGSADWSTREKATIELGAFGYLAMPLLRKELSRTGDPEVEMRLEEILRKLN
ncbi:MAG: hypothetical protein AAGC68_05560, partial [Verrucomicrobiota bacterium]